jgi:hypothetical protein
MLVIVKFELRNPGTEHAFYEKMVSIFLFDHIEPNFEMTQQLFDEEFLCLMPTKVQARYNKGGTWISYRLNDTVEAGFNQTLTEKWNQIERECLVELEK